MHWDRFFVLLSRMCLLVMHLHFADVLVISMQCETASNQYVCTLMSQRQTSIYFLSW